MRIGIKDEKLDTRRMDVAGSGKSADVRCNTGIANGQFQSYMVNKGRAQIDLCAPCSAGEKYSYSYVAQL